MKIHLLILPQAIDQDEGRFGQVTYSIEVGYFRFEITIISNADLFHTKNRKWTRSQMQIVPLRSTPEVVAASLA